MRTDGPRVALLSAIGIPIAIVAAIDLSDSRGAVLTFAFMLAVSLPRWYGWRSAAGSLAAPVGW
jgi:hypothetical protein